MDPEQYKGVEFYKSSGCSRCRNTGFFGRTALFELLEMKLPIRKIIFEGGNQDELRAEALTTGMVTLRDAGVRKAVAGKISLEEVKSKTIEED